MSAVVLLVVTESVSEPFILFPLPLAVDFVLVADEVAVGRGVRVEPLTKQGSH